MQRLVKQGIHRRAARLYKNKIKDAKRQSWERLVADATNDDPYSLAYRLGADKVRVTEIMTIVKTDDNYTSGNTEHNDNTNVQISTAR